VSAALGVALGVAGALGSRMVLRRVLMQGPPWRLALAVRFDDPAVGPQGEALHSNRTVLVIRTQWGRIAEYEDFYEDRGRIEAFEKRLRELGVEAAA
jgi:hypothetical protein